MPQPPRRICHDSQIGQRGQAGTIQSARTSARGLARQKRANSGRYLVVFFIYKLNRVALVISAREMDDKERKRYGRK